MKKGIVGLMVVVSIGLAGAVAAMKVIDDDKPPVIDFQEDTEVTYTEGDSYDVFLEGVTAEDNRDGDVTGSLVVESVYPTEKGDTAMVIYVARDAKNNVAKVSRWVTCKAEKEDKKETEKEDSMAEQEENQTQESTDGDSSDNPRIALTTDNVTIQAGEEIERFSYIEDVSDDKDDVGSLLQNIRIDGDEFDPNTPGVYEQIYYVVDSDGNKSNEATLTITVE